MKQKGFTGTKTEKQMKEKRKNGQDGDDRERANNKAERQRFLKKSKKTP